MEIGSILLIVALLLLVALFVGRPFLASSAEEGGAEGEVDYRSEFEKDHQLSALLAERDRVLTALQELDFDNQLGKIPPEDYPAQRQRLAAYGADVLRQIDELAGKDSAGDVSQPASAEERLEQAVSTRSLDAGVKRTNGSAVVSAAVAAPDDDLEVLLANRRRTVQEPTAGFCHQCGSPLHQSDQFCSKCGASIKLETVK